MVTPLNEFTFRANPNYQAIPYNRLRNEEIQALTSWRQDPESFGVLYPKTRQNLPVTAISCDTALLFFTLQNPGPLPDYLQMSFSQDNQELIALILDRVLEILGPDGYVSGPSALSLLGLELKLSDNKLAHLSYSAIQYAQHLEIFDPNHLSFKLYSYNRLPVTRNWLRLLPDQNAVLSYLNIGPGQSNEKILLKNWRVLEQIEGWLPFGVRTIKPGLRKTSHKLFVSPKVETLPEIFGTITEIFAVKGALQFKIGCDCYGLFRPDKLVAYFTSKEDLFEAACALETRLGGVPVHGVPFTADAGGNGLLSWGMDPYGSADIEGLSWRHWITNRLAAGLIIARSIPESKGEPWRFALERLSLEGVDSNTFAPNASWKGVKTA